MQSNKGTEIQRTLVDIMTYGISSAEGFTNLQEHILDVIIQRDEYALLLFQPCGETHHDANKCPYCKENLNGKS